jgi:hypothetical protein
LIDVFARDAPGLSATAHASDERILLRKTAYYSHAMWTRRDVALQDQDFLGVHVADQQALEVRRTGTW